MNTTLIEFIPATGALAAVSALVYAVWIAIRQRGFHSAIAERQTAVVSGLGDEKVLSVANASRGVVGLFEYASELRPDYIVGVNRGGAVVGAYLSLCLDVGDKRFATCYVERDGLAECGKQQELSGTVLVVDDITRTGKTLEILRTHLEETFPQIKKTVMATLVAAVDANGEPKFKKLDFAALLTKNQHLTLPWDPRIAGPSIRAAQSNSTEPEEFQSIEALSFDVLTKTGPELLRSVASTRTRSGVIAPSRLRTSD
jgi:adenine/guanine phosphoribosyltransferase-like PRPP-binding protein